MKVIKYQVSMWQNMKDNHSSMTNQSLTKKTSLLGNVHISKKKRGIFVPEEKRTGEDIKERRRNMLRMSSRWINNKIRREILNYYYSVENGTWLCDKNRIFQ